MKIGILGGGNVGGALATRWRSAGHAVTVSTRETIASTAAAKDAVVLAVPSTAVADVLAAAGSLGGTVVIDATNNLSGGPDGGSIAAMIADAPVVKAFNTVFARYLAEPPSPPASLVFSGDDAAAKALVAGLIDDLGFEPVDAGGADATPHVEAFAKLVIGIAYSQGKGPFTYRFEGT